MKLKQKITLASAAILIIPTVLITSIAIYNIRNKTTTDIQNYREEQFEKSKIRLENVVDLAYGILENEYNSTDSITHALASLAKLRYDGSEGYFWITDTSVPPVMLMHAASPELNGRVMSSDFLNDTEDIDSQNSYSERAKLTRQNGEAYVEYKMVKPGEDKVYSKLSYSRWFQPLDLVLASGIYTDSIDEAVALKEKELKSQVSKIVWQSIIIALIILTIGLFFTFRFSLVLVDSIVAVRNKLTDLSKGRLVEKIHSKNKDEIGDMAISLDRLIDSTQKYISLTRSIRKGDMSASVDAHDEEDLFANELLLMRNNLTTVIEDTNHALQKAKNEGDLSAKITTSNKEGVWLEMAESNNRLLDSLAEPMSEVKGIIGGMANGDLTGRYRKESKGDFLKLAESINLSLSQLSNLLQQFVLTTGTVQNYSLEMLSTGEEMSSTTNEIATAISQMSTGAQSQVTKIDEVSSLIETVLSSASDMKTKAEEINIVARKGSEKSNTGGEMLKELIKSIEGINAQAAITKENIDVLRMRSEEISQVLTVITEIATQTNLLALNAAIEAAQAGDAGRGFAVVAEEIRKLAEDSRQSATKIEKLIQEVAKDTNYASEAMDKMTDRVSSGTKLSSEASKIFSEINTSSDSTYDLSNQIAAFTSDQVESIKEVVGITEGIAVIAEQTAAGSEEIAASSSELATGMNNYKMKITELSSIASDLADELSKLRIH